MKLDFRSEIPAYNQFWELFQTTGWKEKYQLSPDDLIRALRSSWYLLGAYEKRGFRARPEDAPGMQYIG